MDNKDFLIAELVKRIESLEQKTSSMKNESSQDVAVIGMHCFFPGGSNSPESYWNNLCSGFNAIGVPPKDRVYLDSTMQEYRGGYIEKSISEFNAGFFEIDPEECNYVDPQHRLLLETSYKAIDDAGINRQKLAETSTGIYIGIATCDYQVLMDYYANSVNESVAKGLSASSAAGRIAYALKTEGPTLTVNTACSSALVAVHLAREALCHYETDLAIVGGVNLLLAPNNFIIFSKEGVLSKTGSCKVFDEDADGYVRGEGCGVLVLKRAADAIHDGNRIHAIIKGSAINQNGAASGYTVPRVKCQADVLKNAAQAGGVSLSEIGYLELGSSGTKLGDQIEGDAISHVFQKAQLNAPLMLGSVKTNVGHLEAASGMAGLIKTILILQHQYIPPHLHFNHLNKALNLETIPAKVVVNGQEWRLPDSQKSRYAGVSSYGFTGANAHVVLEEPPKQEQNAQITGIAGTKYDDLSRQKYWFAESKREQSAYETHYPWIASAEMLSDLSLLFKINNDELWDALTPVELMQEVVELIQEQLWVTHPIHLEHVELLTPMVPGNEVEIQVLIKPNGPDFDLLLSYKQSNQWVLSAKARLLDYQLEPGVDYKTIEHISIEALMEQCPQDLAIEDSSYLGFIKRGEKNLLCQLKLPEEKGNYCVSPISFNSAFRLISALTGADYLPVSCDSIDYFYTAAPAYVSLSILDSQQSRLLVNLQFIDKEGRVKLKMNQLLLQAGIAEKAMNQSLNKQEFINYTAWVPVPQAELNTAIEGNYYLLASAGRIKESLSTARITLVNNIMEANTVICCVWNDDYEMELNTLLKELRQSIRIQVPRIIIVSQQLALIGSSIAPKLSGVLGVYKSLKIEDPQIKLHLIDVDHIEHDIHGALSSQAEDILAYRQGAFYRYRLLPLNEPVPLKTAHFNPEDVYLIAGDLGISAQKMRAYLMSRGVRTLYVAGSDEHADLNVDLTVKEDVEKALSPIKNSLKGIFYFAEPMDDAQDQKNAIELFKTKTAAVLVLHEVSQLLHLPLNFFVLSNSFKIGLGLTLPPLAGIGSFFEQLAGLRKTLGLPALSLNWDAQDTNFDLEQVLQLSVPSIFLGNVSQELGQLEHPPIWVAPVYSRLQETPLIIKRLQETSYEAREGLLKSLLSDILREIMQQPDMHIDCDTGFFDLGLTSLNAVDAKDLLQKRIGDNYHLSNSLFFEQSTLNALHQWLVTQRLAEYFKLGTEHYEKMGTDAVLEMANKLIHQRETTSENSVNLHVFDLKKDMERYLDDSTSVIASAESMSIPVKHMLSVVDSHNQVEYLTCGQGQPVVYFQGALTNMNMALLQFQTLLEKHSHSYQFIFINPPGIGQSKCSTLQEGYAALEKVLSDLLKGHKARFITYSAGAIIALYFLKKDVFGIDDALFFVPPSPFDKNLAHENRNLKKLNEDLANTLKEECKKNNVTMPELYTKAFFAGEASQYEHVLLPDFFPDKENEISDCGFTLVHAQQDILFDTEQSVRFYKNYLGDRIRKQKYVDAGHFLVFTHQDLFNQLISDFLG